MIDEYENKVDKLTLDIERRLCSSSLTDEQKGCVSETWKSTIEAISLTIKDPRLSVIPLSVMRIDFKSLSRKVASGLIPHLEEHPLVIKVKVRNRWMWWQRHLSVMVMFDSEYLNHLRDTLSEV